MSEGTAAGHDAVLGCDLDCTLWDFMGWMCDSVSARLGERLGREIAPAEVSSWDHFVRLGAQCGPDGGAAIKACFEEALDPGRIDERPIFEGAVEELLSLRQRGVRLVFVSLNPDPTRMYEPVSGWLRRLLGDGGFALHILPEGISKIHTLRAEGAVGLVDDKPATIRESAAAGLWTAAPLYPYNRRTVASTREVRGFESWSEFPAESFLEHPRAG